jgi:uncharacterized protein YgiM (DUF1202 family)
VLIIEKLGGKFVTINSEFIPDVYSSQSSVVDFLTFVKTNTMRQILYVILTFTLMCNHAFAQGRKCTGSANCTACTTCSGCKHCNEGGGTCGVCSSGNHYKGGSNGNSGSGSIPEYKPKVIPKPQKAIGDLYKVSATTLNLRTGPGTSYSIVKELPYGTLVSLVTTSGSWLQVKVVSSGEIGYVLSNYIVKN